MPCDADELGSQHPRREAPSGRRHHRPGRCRTGYGCWLLRTFVRSGLVEISYAGSTSLTPRPSFTSPWGRSRPIASTVTLGLGWVVRGVLQAQGPVPGDLVTVDRADNTSSVFKVVDKVTYSRANFPDDMVYRVAGKPSPHLVTCDGFDPAVGHNGGNLVDFADLISSGPQVVRGEAGSPAGRLSARVEAAHACGGRGSRQPCHDRPHHRRWYGGCCCRLGRATDLNRCCPGSVGSLGAVRPIVENDRTARTSAAPRPETAASPVRPVSARSPSRDAPTRS